MASGRGYRVLFPGLKLQGIMGYRASIRLRGSNGPSPTDDPILPPPPPCPRTISRRQEASSDTKQYLYIYLYTYIYFRKEQGTGSKQAWGRFPLPTRVRVDMINTSQLRGRVVGGSYVGGRGCAMHMQAFLEAVTWTGALVH